MQTTIHGRPSFTCFSESPYAEHVSCSALTHRKLRPAARAMDSAMNVFPVPGGPNSSIDCTWGVRKHKTQCTPHQVLRSAADCVKQPHQPEACTATAVCQDHAHASESLAQPTGTRQHTALTLGGAVGSPALLDPYFSSLTTRMMKEPTRLSPTGSLACLHVRYASAVVEQQWCAHARGAIGHMQLRDDT